MNLNKIEKTYNNGVFSTFDGETFGKDCVSCFQSGGTVYEVNTDDNVDTLGFILEHPLGTVFVGISSIQRIKLDKQIIPNMYGLEDGQIIPNMYGEVE
jgi:hypothetical protein